MKTYTVRKGKTMVQLDFLCTNFGTYSVTAHVNIDTYHGVLKQNPYEIWNEDKGITDQFVRLTNNLNDKDLNNFIEETLIKEIK